MARENGTPARRWLSGFGTLDWRTDERAYATLLDALTRDLLEVEAVERQMQAPASSGLLAEEQERAERDELAEARRELDEFRVAMDDIRRRGGGGQTSPSAEVPYDSREADQNAAADVLIQYLVRPGYAEVRTEEPSEGEYVYYIRVDWPRLAELAEAQGQPLTF